MQLTGIQALGLLTSLGVPAVALLLALLPVRRERLERFATTFGVTVTTTNGRELIRYLERTRRYRSLGGVLGWMLGLTVPVLGAFAAKEVWAIGGYLAGAHPPPVPAPPRWCPGEWPTTSHPPPASCCQCCPHSPSRCSPSASAIPWVTPRPWTRA